MFDTTKEDLKDLLRSINEGKLQLPDFQRDWVWSDADIRSLLASIGRGFPVGALLTLQTGGEVSFKPRVLEGAPDQGVLPEEYLLDGQQRLTSLYQATFGKAAVLTKNAKGEGVRRFYYLDIKKALDDYQTFEDAIVGVPEDRIFRTNFGKKVALDLSSPDQEYEKHMFPMNSLFHGPEWIYNWRRHWEGRGDDVATLAMKFQELVFDRFTRYKMPVIKLDKSNGREAVCVIFEKVNVGGKKLDAFELLTAIFAASKFDLRHDWLGDPKNGQPGRLERIRGISNPRHVFKELASLDFLQACTVLHTRDRRIEAQQTTGKQGRDLPAISCSRASLLQLPVEAYKRYADAIEAGFIEAGRFLNNQKIFWQTDVPYPPQLVVLAAVFAVMGRKAETAAAVDKLEQWFWCGVLGEVFGSSSETKIARDVPELVDWIAGTGPQPETIQSAYLQIERLDKLRTRQSAAYKGMHALLMKSGSRDFVTGKTAELMTVYQDNIDIHHIFPKKWCIDNGIEPAVYNSIINKTALSARSNRMIGGVAPSAYLGRIEKDESAEPEQLDNIIETHDISAETLRADDFEKFWSERRKKLAGLAAKAMGKDVILDSEPEEPTIEMADELEDVMESELHEAG
ncbi:GmrSD restriction endonuclease domain-containing protein [Salinisphaera aquimarina]|uniref:DUF262 domain-containing protein n=1 Tax=Salinisphaera aquimarina TaxID=2094031 RepID=A0ABV7EST0_9GAMM